MATKRLKWRMEADGDVHFFVSSVAEWHVGVDPTELIARMKRTGFPFSLWVVPTAVDAPYQIEGFAPQVEGAKRIALFDMKG